MSRSRISIPVEVGHRPLQRKLSGACCLNGDSWTLDFDRKSKFYGKEDRTLLLSASKEYWSFISTNQIVIHFEFDIHKYSVEFYASK